MKLSLRTSLAAFVLSTALAGAAAPAFADSYYQGIDPHAIKPRPTTQSQMMYDNRSVDRMPTGSIYQTAPPRVIYQNPQLQDRYQGGDGDYYQGIVAPTY
ncbi:hypothetical protein AC244_22195 [Ensifer adhaerens]|uniref:Uncharacterized protein n=1 Tax=Ensifer adhaerens TaxID=106592 RepID=A0A0L8BMC1_ENSAD|nr:hypothetical protein [Ensifer adhaerens]KOF15709.1 hypothetical protein AC244_22195 [Ensifer adhaerens]